MSVSLRTIVYPRLYLHRAWIVFFRRSRILVILDFLPISILSFSRCLRTCLLFLRLPFPHFCYKFVSSVLCFPATYVFSAMILAASPTFVYLLCLPVRWLPLASHQCSVNKLRCYKSDHSRLSPSTSYHSRSLPFSKSFPQTRTI